jgi:prevent-host-death family protein
MERNIDVTSARRQLGTLLDEVFHKGDIVTIERKGKPLAKIVPLRDTNDQDTQHSIISSRQRVLLEELNSLPAIGIDKDPVNILRSIRTSKKESRQVWNMVSNRYVLDANVFLEYIYASSLNKKAKQILQDAILEQIQILVPSLALDEITEVLCGNLDNLAEVQTHLRYIEKLANQAVLHIVVPNSEVRMKAIELARTGNQKIGYPELTDCLYHALAILNDAIFITNDQKHICKVKQFGHIQELSMYND